MNLRVVSNADNHSRRFIGIISKIFDTVANTWHIIYSLFCFAPLIPAGVSDFHVGGPPSIEA